MVDYGTDDVVGTTIPKSLLLLSKRSPLLVLLSPNATLMEEKKN